MEKAKQPASTYLPSKHSTHTHTHTELVQHSDLHRKGGHLSSALPFPVDWVLGRHVGCTPRVGLPVGTLGNDFAPDKFCL